MEIIILGSGTSAGVPVIGCHCEVCDGLEPKNQRSRASIAIIYRGKTILIDTAPELRIQLRKAKIDRADAILYTHLHADHLHGFDDIRAFGFTDSTPVPVYLRDTYMEELTTRFSYAFQDTGYKGARPIVELRRIDSQPFNFLDIEIDPIELPHGSVTTSAFRIDNFAYATDFKRFSLEQIERWKGKIHTMIASGIHFGQHDTHSVIPETIDLFDKLEVQRGIISHLAHQVDYVRDSPKLPKHVEFAYDDMRVVL